MSNAKLIYDSSEKNSDLYYATHFWAPDPILFIEHRGRKLLILSDLELERGKKEAHVDKILSLSHFQERAKREGKKGVVGLVDTVLKGLQIKKLTLPPSSPFVFVDGLRKKGYAVTAGEIPFYPQRAIKTSREKRCIAQAQRTVFKTIALAEKILRESTLRKGWLYWKKKILTAERLRFEMDRYLLEQGYHSKDIIIACGLQGTDPHCLGSGPLKAHQSIIIDVFPRNAKTKFFGDATRTFCKGKAPPELKKLYTTVKQAQEMAISKIRAGVSGGKINQTVKDFFEKNGFPTKEINGFKQGFIHNTGHGIGLDLHEEPARIATTDFTLQAGNMVTVEPGLYYRKIGAVRLEDIVYVTPRGSELLPTYSKRLEIL